MSADGSAAFLAARNVSRETEARLRHFEDLLTRWNARINLVARSTLPELWTRHILDSVQLLDSVETPSGLWADLGSGGGFPGLVVAILARDEAPGLRLTLVESDSRKAAFLATASRDLDLPVTVRAERIESLPPLNADILSARALAPLPQLLAHAERHLKPGGIALFPKGAAHEAEIAEALASWRFTVQKRPSKTDPHAVILKIGDIARV